MPTAVTEVDHFDTTIECPNPGESASASQVLEGFVQRLTNRTKYLKGKVDQIGIAVPNSSFVAVAAALATINYTSSSTGGYILLTDTASPTPHDLGIGFANAKKNDVIRGSVYFKLNTTSGSNLLLNVRVYEDSTDAKDVTIQVTGTSLQFVTIPVFHVVSADGPLTLGVQVWASISGGSTTIQELTGSHEWGDFEILRPIA